VMPRILLVEDDPSDEKLAILAFKRCELPHEVVVRRDGAQALEYLLGNGANSPEGLGTLPRLVLLDLKLPRVDGLDVLRQLRDNDRTRLLPIVVLSASREDSDLKASLSLGANAYVRKPLDFVEFQAAARTLVQFWLQLNEALPPGQRLE
jgi:two-component system, response regulator